MLDALYRTVYRVAYRLHLLWAFLFRPRCEGVWVAIWCGDSLLVIRNAYRKRLTLPGGGIDGGEEPLAAAIRELREEVGITLAPQQLRFVGQFRSAIEFKRDTINLFDVQLSEQPLVTIDKREVVYAEFLDPAALSPDAVFPVMLEYLAAAAAEPENAENGANAGS